METKTISAQEFVNQMCSRHGTVIGSLFTRTKLIPGKHLKVSYPQEVIVLGEGRNCMVGVNYEAAVNRQRVREGKEADFVVENRKWGTRIFRENGKPTPFVIHTPKGSDCQKIYMTITIRWDKLPKYETVSGEDIFYSDLLPYFYNRSENSKQDLDVPVEPRDYELKNIYGWKSGDIYYDIIHSSDDIITIPRG